MSTDSTTDLYRYFDAEGRLLYVGISFSAIARAAQHREDKGWWQDVARMHVEHLPTRSDAVNAERHAIRTEQPLHNVVHNGKISAAKLERQMRRNDPAEVRRVIKEMEADTYTFVGKYFLTPPDEGEFPCVNRQGRVVGEPSSETYVIQLYSWWDGRPTTQEIVSFDGMRGWRFYETHQRWLDAGEIGMRANDLEADGRLGA